MSSEIFSFALQPGMIYPLIGLSAFSFLFYKVSRIKPRLESHQWLLFYLGVFITGGIFDLLSNSSINPTEVTLFNILFQICNIFSFAPLLGFVLVYTNHSNWIKTLPRKILLFIPPTFAAGLLIFTDLITVHDPALTHNNDHLYNIWEVPHGPLYEPLYVGLIQIVVIISIILLVRHALKSKDKERRYRSFLLSGTLFAQQVFDILMFVVLPGILNSPVIPDGIISGWIMGVVFSLETINNRLFTVNPAAYVENIVSTISETIFVVNKDFYIEEYKGPMKETLGYDSDDLYGKHFQEFVACNWKDMGRLFESIENGASIKKECDLVMIDGKTIPVQLSVSGFYSNEILTGYVILVTDLSATKQLVHVEAERNKLNVVIESIQDAIVAVDFNLNVVMQNKKFGELVGKKEENILGKNLVKLIGVNEADKPIDFNALKWEGELTEDKELMNYEDVQLQVGKKSIPVNMIGSAIKEGKEIDLAAIIVFQDLSAQEEFEKMKLDFVSMAAHELRTPLTSIHGYFSVLTEELQDTFNEDQQMYANRINIAQQQLEALMENLLAASNIENGKYNLRKIESDWEHLVETAVNGQQLQAQNAGVTLLFEKPDKIIPVVAVDALRITEVLNNLISNGIKYSPHGHVTVSVKYNSAEKEIMTLFKDDGEGIMPEAMDHMFEKFYRAWGSLEMSEKGAGLGLYISKAIVELHGGKIWAESEGPGRGSTFMFTLPVK